MIPPLHTIRRRSISRWMQENRPGIHVTEERVNELDDQMIQAFQASEEALMERMMSAQTWGYPAPMREFNTRRLEMWAEVVEEFLPATSD